MPKKMLHSEFNKKIQFGIIKNIENDITGGYDSKFISEISLWSKITHLNSSNRYQIVGNDLSRTILVIVRHNEKINDLNKAMYKNQVYDILDISADDSNYMSYDYITMQLHKKV